MAVCQRDGCENELPPPVNGYPRNPRKWCSENCRKRAVDAAHRKSCPRCGKPQGARSAWPSVSHPYRRCWDCDRLLRRIRHEARIFYAAHLYRQGKSLVEIAATLGMGPNSRPPELTEARRRGLIGYRNRGYGEAA